MIETVRDERVWESVQHLGHVSERTNSDRDDDTSGACVLTIAEVQLKFIAAQFNRTDLNFLQIRHATLLEGQPVFTEMIEPDRLRFAVID